LPLSSLGADANVFPNHGFILRARYGFRVIGNCGLPSSLLSEFLVGVGAHVGANARSRRGDIEG